MAKRNKGRNPPAKSPLSSNSGVQTSPQNTTAIQQTTEHFSGPIPRPDILRHYNEIVPGAAERILKMAEEDARHQRDIEMAALDAAKTESARGQHYGFLIGLSALITTGIALYLGYDKVAMVLGGTTVVGLVTVFVTGRLQMNK